MPWTVCTPAVPPDWLLRSAEEIANAVMVRVKRGAIISLHDGRPPHATPTGSLPTREATARAIDIVLENVSADYRLLTVAELLAASGRGHGSLRVASPEMRSAERKQSDLK